MVDLTRPGLPHERALRALEFAGARRRVRYELWALRGGAYYRRLALLEKWLRCDYLAPVKYTGRFVVRDDPAVDWRQDLVQLMMVLTVEGEEYAYPFPRLKPMRVRGFETRTLECCDETVMLQVSTLGRRLFLPKGTGYLQAVAGLIGQAGLKRVLLEPSAAVLAADREDWEPETCLLTLVNALLGEMGYTSLEVDRSSVVRAGPYTPPSAAQCRIRYAAGPQSVLLQGEERELDNFDKPNRFVGYVSNPDGEPLQYEYLNDNPASPTAPQNNGGYVVTAARRFDQVADGESLRRNVERWAAESGLMYERVTLRTAVMPHHEVREIVGVDCQRVRGTFTETAWEIGEDMTHELRRMAL